MKPCARSAAKLVRMPESRRRPTVWIVLSCVLAAAAVGLGVWALNAQSDADDAQAALAASEQAAAKATPEPTPTAAPAEPDPAVQQQIEQLATDLGATSDAVANIEQQIEQAAKKVADATQAREDATGALDAARADVESFKARLELAQTCLRGTVDAVASAFEAGGTEAAAAKVQTLVGNCSSS